MKNLLRPCIALLASISILVSGNLPLSAQQAASMRHGILRIKVTEALAGQLQNKKFKTTSSGEILTGIESLDHIHRQFKVKHLTRVFRDAGKNEARHRKHGLHLWYEVKMDKSNSVSEAVKAYRSDKQIVEAEPVYEKIINDGAHDRALTSILIKKSFEPALPGGSNDPQVGGQWHYHNTGQSGGTVGADIRLFDAWKIETGKKEVIVAITDGGIQSDHPDLSANVWVNAGEIPANNKDDDSNGFIDDVHGYSFVTNSGRIAAHDHGTHVAGTIGAVSNNGLGVAGVAGGSGTGDGVRLMSCAVFSEDYPPDGFAEAYVYAADNGAVISQNSWGYSIPGLWEQSVLDAIDYFIAEAGKDEHGNQTGPMNGGLVIFSAGNDYSEEPFFPGAYEPVLAVAASTHNDTKARYSNFGSWVDITAPGGETFETQARGVLSTLSNSQYGSFMGTSMACPHVSGVAGLVISKYGNAGLLPHALRERLLHSVKDIDELNPLYEGKLGSGRINAALALGAGDDTPPQRVTNLSVSGSDVGEITLTWTSPYDESGFISAYDVRYSTSPITETNFASATSASGISPPKPIGDTETFTVKGLKGGILYYFALRSVDFEGNISAISNVISKTAVLTPVIAVNPSSLSENLMTAQTSRKIFSISNTGQGPLKFTLLERDENDFASSTPTAGEIVPGDRRDITVTFDAAGLMTGTYAADLTISSNDPERNSVVMPITLNVTNNNAPIASVNPAQVDFVSSQVGSAVRRQITLSNAGSDPLIIEKLTSSNDVFGAEFTGAMEIQPFKEKMVYLTFSPQSTGSFTGEMYIHTNDPDDKVLIVKVRGEGLNEPPLSVSPESFNETVEIKKGVTRNLTLQNNSSFDRAFRIEVTDTDVVMEQAVALAGKKTSSSSHDTSTSRLRAMVKKNQEELAKKSKELNALVKPLTTQSNGTNAGRIRVSTASEILEYSTGFEDFNPGSISGQHGWFSSQGWTVSTENPDAGAKHFRGTSMASGTGETIAVSPMLAYPEYSIPRYTSTSVRLNVEMAKGTTWQLVTQDEYFVANRIRFNADGTIDSWVIDNDYNFHWKRVPVPTPSGYFDLAIEYNNWGSDTSGFPTYHLFINNQYAMSGTGLGFGIAQVAFVTPLSVSGPVLDVDNLIIKGDEFNGAFVRPSRWDGVVAAGESLDIGLTFDAIAMKYGKYESDIVVHLDEVDSVIVPAKLTVTGKAFLSLSDHFISLESDKGHTATKQATLTNLGGVPVKFKFDYDLPGLTVEPGEGTVAVRENIPVVFKFDDKPGIYDESVAFITDDPDRPTTDVSVNIVVFDSGAVFSAPDKVEFDIKAGEISAHTIQVANDGANTVTYRSSLPLFTEWISLDPGLATISDDPLDVVVTFDARELTAGTKHAWVNFSVNDRTDPYHRMECIINVLEDTARAGKIVREVWSNVSGNTVASIPLHQQPSDSSVLRIFQSPSNTGDNYGTRIRGYIRPPVRGWYTFWISSNDHSELWLSEDTNPVKKQKIAWVNGYTNPLQWDKYTSQKSESIFLEINQMYYIEALHKEGVGTDHLAVGWEIPGMQNTLERPIAGRHLVPYEIYTSNVSPQVTVISPLEGQIFVAGSTVQIQADAMDEDGSIARVEFFRGPSKIGVDITAPYEFTYKDLKEGNHFIWARATDNLGATDSSGVNIILKGGSSCEEAGLIAREQWNGVRGDQVAAIPIDKEPSFVQTLTMFESPANTGDNYGGRIRGFVCVPVAGNYTFWIASNDHSELWLSSDANPANKKRISYVIGYTSPRQWNKFPNQQSTPVYLEPGRKYYIEALHKEGVGTDHLAVGWRLPDGTLERPIPGMRLLPFTVTGNRQPVVTITEPQDNATFSAPATVEIRADATDEENNILKVEFFNAGVKIGEDIAAPYAFSWFDVTEGNYVLTARAIDREGLTATSQAVNIIVQSECRGSGTITREYWRGISGNFVSSVPVNNTPDGSEELLLFEGPTGAGTNYAARISGYICAPATGEYYFWISSNDHSELWLSTDADPANKTRIAYLTAATGEREWQKFPTQQSLPVSLTRGHTYFIEALHKQGIGSDHVAVGWQLPDGSLERPIPGTRLSPMNSEHPSLLHQEGSTSGAKENHSALKVYPNPLNGDKLNVEIGAFEARENQDAEIVIHDLTGLSVYEEKLPCAESCRTEINVAGKLKSGVYLLQIRQGSKTMTEKLIVR